MRSRIALILGWLYLAMTLVAACEAAAPVDNDPVPLPADLAAIVNARLAIPLRPADGSVPPISPTKALEIAGVALLRDLDSNKMPRQDPSVPDGLVRRVIVGPQGPTSAWLVVYRWAAGSDCGSPASGPGRCEATSFYFINDRTGKLITGHTETR